MDNPIELEQYYHVHGNEDDTSYSYRNQMKLFDNSTKFQKTIMVSHDNNILDIYEEAFIFDDYIFMVGIEIQKIKQEISAEFVKKFKCDIDNENYCIIWNYKQKAWTTNFVRPNPIFKEYSEKLYDKYLKYYNQMVIVSKNSDYICLKT